MIPQTILNYFQYSSPSSPTLTPKECQSKEEFLTILKNFAKLGKSGFERASYQSSNEGCIPTASSSQTLAGRVLEWYYRPTTISPGLLETFFPAFLQKNQRHINDLPNRQILKNLRYLSNCFGMETGIRRYLEEKIQELSKIDSETFNQAISANEAKQEIVNDREALERKLADHLDEIDQEFEPIINENQLKFSELKFVFELDEKEFRVQEERASAKLKKLKMRIDSIKDCETTNEVKNNALLKEAFAEYAPAAEHDIAIASENNDDLTQFITTSRTFFGKNSWVNSDLRTIDRNKDNKVKISDGRELPLYSLPYPQHIIAIAVQYFSGLPRIYNVRLRDLDQLLDLANYLDKPEFKEWVASNINKLLIDADTGRAIPWLLEDARIPDTIYQYAITVIAASFSDLTQENLKEISPKCILDIIPKLDVNYNNLRTIRIWISLHNTNDKETTEVAEKVELFRARVDAKQKETFKNFAKDKDKNKDKIFKFLKDYKNDFDSEYLMDFISKDEKKTLFNEVLFKKMYSSESILKLCLEHLKPFEFEKISIEDLIKRKYVYQYDESRINNADLYQAVYISNVLDELYQAKRFISDAEKTELKEKIKKTKQCYDRLHKEAQNINANIEQVLKNESDRLKDLKANFDESIADHKEKKEKELKVIVSELENLEQAYTNLKQEHSQTMQKLNNELVRLKQEKNEFDQLDRILSLDNPNARRLFFKIESHLAALADYNS